MRLQIDASVLYALGRHKDQLSYNDLTVASPYNTYLHYGLPPTPIDNPGLASLTAAANPVQSAYLYYVGRADGTGPLYFSNTYAQFLKRRRASAAVAGRPCGAQRPRITWREFATHATGGNQTTRVGARPAYRSPLIVVAAALLTAPRSPACSGSSPAAPSR